MLAWPLPTSYLHACPVLPPGQGDRMDLLPHTGGPHCTLGSGLGRWAGGTVG